MGKIYNEKDRQKIVDLIDSGSPAKIVADEFDMTVDRVKTIYVRETEGMGRVSKGHKPRITIERRRKRILDIQRRRKRGERLSRLSRQYGVTPQRIIQITNQSPVYKGSAADSCPVGRPLVEIVDRYELWTLLINKMRDRRIERGLRIVDVVEAMKPTMTIGYYSRFESGHKPMNGARILVALKVLGIEIDSVFPTQGYKTPTQLAKEFHCKVEEVFDAMSTVLSGRLGNASDRRNSKSVKSGSADRPARHKR